MRLEPLFSPGAASDSAYCYLRDAPDPGAAASQQFAEALWADYHRYADPHFLSEIRSQFHVRFWEMYLTCALLQRAAEQGYSMPPPTPPEQKEGRPDVLLEHAGRRIWIEAVMVTDGETGKPDSIVPQQSGEIPDEKIILRYTAAIKTKHDALLVYRAKGIVGEGDAYVVAVNPIRMSYCWAGGATPRYLAPLYRMGYLTYTIAADSKELLDPWIQSRPDITKANQAPPISTGMFLSEQYRGISAVLHSCANEQMHACPLGVDLMLAHNNLHAACPLPPGLIRVDREYRVTLQDDGSHQVSCLRTPLQGGTDDCR